MPKFKRLLSFLLALCALLPVTSASFFTAEAIATFPSVSARAAILTLDDGETVIYNKDANVRLPMASTTKIMTALVAAELASFDTPITVDAQAVGTEGSSVYLVAGEVLTLEQLLYALLLESANDAAVAIAIALSGSVDAFAEQMNQKARDLGLSDTHFENPHGLDGESHYTTAADLAKIACAVLKEPRLRTIVSSRKATIPHPDTDTDRLLVNHNKLLRLYDGCIGVKTGYTQRSGRCLVSAAERDGVTLVAVTLNASNDWEDHSQMLDYGFSLYSSRDLCAAGELTHPLPWVGGTDAYVLLSNVHSVSVTLPRSATDVDLRIECRPFEYATVTEGEHLGDAVFLCDTNGDGSREALARVPLLAVCTVEKRTKKISLWSWILRRFGKDTTENG